MCGIAGIVNHHGRNDVAGKLQLLGGAMRHRGPDGCGSFLDEDAALIHRRLAVIDPSGGKQPIASEDGQVIAMLNGEIYNHRKIREELELRGHVFRTRCDAEVLVHLYEETGPECTAYLEGMYSFAVYNRRNRRLLLVRDRLGQKPLFYFMRGDTFYFASCLEALEKLPEMPRALDVESIRGFLSTHVISFPDTIYSAVRQLPPAHQLVFRGDEGTLSIYNYWNPSYLHKEELSFNDAAAEVRRLTEKAVEKRLMADVPLGCFLSGGMDSAIITALAAKLRQDQETECFTIAFADPAYDERKFAGSAASAINRHCSGRLKPNIREIDPCSFELLETLSARCGQPFADASILPTALLSSFAREKVTVALSGDGADEVFCGYERYLACALANRIDAIPGATLCRFLARTGAALLPGNSMERTCCARLRRLLKLIGENSENRWHGLLDHCPRSIGEQLFGEQLVVERTRVIEPLRWDQTAADPVEQLCESDLHDYLPNDILFKVDTASMASSLEVRSPFLDRELVEFAAALPVEYKLHGFSRKHILKAAFSDLIPQELLNRRKRGFGIPLSAWLRGPWRKPAEEMIFDSPLISGKYFRETPLRNLFRAHAEEKCDAGYLLWGILNLAIFLNHHNN